MFKSLDRIKEFSKTTGTGSLSLQGAAHGGFQRFTDVIGASGLIHYHIEHENRNINEWESGEGTLLSTHLSGNGAKNPTLGRELIYSSSNNGNAVNFSAGCKFVTYVQTQTSSVYCNKTVPAGNTVSNSSSETNFASNYVIKANTLRVGDLLKVTAFGTYGTDAITAGTITFRFKFGSTVLATSAALTNIVGLASRGWMFSCYALVTAIGAGGTIECQGIAGLSTAINTATIADLENTAAIAVNTAIDQTAQMSVEMSVADADNTVTLRQFIIEVSNVV